MGPDAPWNPLYIFDYSGGTFDPNRNELVVWGGGHADYPGNEVCVFSLDAGKWTCVTKRSPFTQDTIDVLADGRPAARHTYSSLAYIPDPAWDGFFVHGGALWWGGWPTSATWFFRRAELRWQALPGRGTEYASKSVVVVSVYDAVRKKVHVRTKNSVESFDLATSTWQSKGGASGQEREITGAFDPERQHFVIVGKGLAEVWNTGKTPWERVPAAMAGDNAPVSAWGPGLVFDPVGKRYLAWSGGRTLYQLNRDTWTWLALTTTGADPGTQYVVGTFGRFSYVPKTHGLVLVNSVDGSVFYHQLPR
jgi:hypothetical protein